MKNLKKFSFYLLMFCLFSITACNSDEDPDDGGGGEEEVITTLTMTLTPVNGGDIVQLSFEDLDGDGGDDPTISGGTLQANAIYSGDIELLNESETPSEDITEEVAEEAEEHQFFFSTTVSGLSVTYSDTDADNNPIGIRTSVTTTDAGTGNMTVILRHEPDKNADGVSGGNISNAGGETDIEVTFPITVQ